MQVLPQFYYNLSRTEDGKNYSTIAWISCYTLPAEREILADKFTKGDYSKHRAFYNISGPHSTPQILSNDE